MHQAEMEGGMLCRSLPGKKLLPRFLRQVFLILHQRSFPKRVCHCYLRQSYEQELRFQKANSTPSVNPKQNLSK
jgi:hypothetical protein